MKKLDKFANVNVGNKNYVVCELPYASSKAPIILDQNVFDKVHNLNKKWKINDKGFVITQVKTNDTIREFALHDIVMRIVDENYFNRNNNVIIHINTLGVDNRSENLMYDITEKDIKKNLKKKKRTISLSEESGIIPDEIPSYVWYVKEDSSHGDRFMLNLGDVSWKSSSSKKLSLRYKLEETKKYMRYLKDVRNDLFEEYSMNGDLNDEGENLIRSYIKIAQTAGFKINNIDLDKQTDIYLKENTNDLSTEEKIYLDFFNPQIGKLNLKF